MAGGRMGRLTGGWRIPAIEKIRELDYKKHYPPQFATLRFVCGCQAAR
jgi:hypothetical protein